MLTQEKEFVQTKELEKNDEHDLIKEQKQKGDQFLFRESTYFSFCFCISLQKSSEAHLKGISLSFITNTISIEVCPKTNC